MDENEIAGVMRMFLRESFGWWDGGRRRRAIMWSVPEDFNALPEDWDASSDTFGDAVRR